MLVEDRPRDTGPSSELVEVQVFRDLGNTDGKQILGVFGVAREMVAPALQELRKDVAFLSLRVSREGVPEGEIEASAGIGFARL